MIELIGFIKKSVKCIDVVAFTRHYAQDKS